MRAICRYKSEPQLTIRSLKAGGHENQPLFQKVIKPL